MASATPSAVSSTAHTPETPSDLGQAWDPFVVLVPPDRFLAAFQVLGIALTVSDAGVVQGTYVRPDGIAEKITGGLDASGTMNWDTHKHNLRPDTMEHLLKDATVKALRRQLGLPRQDDHAATH